MIFWIQGVAVPQRLTFGKGKVFRSSAYKKWVEAIRLQANSHKPDKPFEGAVRLRIEIYWNGKNKQHGEYKPTRPDADNIEKAIFDALTGMFYVDDAQIVRHETVKFWTPDVAEIKIQVEPIEEG